MNKLTTKVHKNSSKRAARRASSPSKDVPFIKKESIFSDGSPRRRKVRERTQTQTPNNSTPMLHLTKRTRKLFDRQASENLINEVSPSIKREQLLEGNSEVRMPNFETRRRTSRELCKSFTTSSHYKEIEVSSSIKRELSFEGITKTKKSNVKTRRKTSAHEASSNSKTPSQNKENVFFPTNKEKDLSPAETSAKVEKESDETKHQTFTPSNTPTGNHWPSPGTSPITPYALNRPQRNRIPPLAYWRGEHRSFRTLRNGDIVLIGLYIPEHSEEPKRKKRRISEKNKKGIKTEMNIN